MKQGSIQDIARWLRERYEYEEKHGEEATGKIEHTYWYGRAKATLAALNYVQVANNLQEAGKCK